MKTILINPPQNNRYPQPPLGIASITAVAGLEKPGKEFDIPVICLSALYALFLRILALCRKSCIPGVPCVTLRDDTEGHETVEVGASVLAGTGAGRIVGCARNMIERERTWENPFGDGMAGER